MITLPAKPPGSAIEVSVEPSRTVIFWKNPRGGFGRYAALLFLLAWMSMWVAGEVSAAASLLKGGNDSFLAFWLVGWTVGGAFCVTMIYKLAQPSRPERLTLDALRLVHEPGTEPYNAFGWSGAWWGGKRQNNPLALFKPRKTVTAAKKDVGEIRLDRVGERQRLSFDCGAKRVEVGQYLEEPEREWLAAVLRSWKMQTPAPLYASAAENYEERFRA